MLEHLGRRTPELEKLRIQQSTWCCSVIVLCPLSKGMFHYHSRAVDLVNCVHMCGVSMQLLSPKWTFWEKIVLVLSLQLLAQCEINLNYLKIVKFLFSYFILIWLCIAHICKVHAKALFCIFADEEEVWKNSCPSYWQAVTVGSYISDRKHQRQLLAIYILNTSAQVC